MAAAPGAYQFASKGYAAKFAGQPEVDADALRAATIDFLKNFDAKSWYDDPIVTILQGKKLLGGPVQKTKDAFEKENGSQILATDAQAEEVRRHIHTYRPPKVDYRDEFRRIDAAFMSLPLAGQIIANQALDYRKQDGITEVVEAKEANVVEQRLNDALLEDEIAGKVKIIRWPAFIGCVSNFSNFLDLSRKVMRNMELGVPVVVLSRNNTTQHMYRWTVLLLDLMRKENVDLGLLTFFSCVRKQKTAVFKACPECPAYFTCSRDVAEDVKKTLPKIMSSTGGPNTMVTGSLTPAVSTALRYSAMIENKGQCTAMRHFVLPECTEGIIDDIFRPTPVINHPLEALESGHFAGLYAGEKYEQSPGYKHLPSQPLIQFRMGRTPPADIDEKWREPIVDVTAPTAAEFRTDAFQRKLCDWLIKEQPITLAVNGDDDLAMSIFERTGLVVYTVGTLEQPGLTAQARPQDGECFGEFPPRSQLEKFTHLPVIIPSSTPGYNTEYTEKHLLEMAEGAYPPALEYCDDLFRGCSPQALGMVKILCAYLADACGPKRGHGYDKGARTSLFGLQRPPILDDSPTVLRAAASASFDQVAPILAPFYVTNARPQLQVSVDPASGIAQDLARFTGVKIITEDVAAFGQRLGTFLPYNVVTVEGKKEFEPLLAFHWVSRLFGMGHIKSVKPRDDAFLAKFSKSKKWLAIEAAPSRL